MKRNFTKAMSVGLLTLSMAILPNLHASAQTNTTDPGNTTTTNTSNSNNRDFDWGWLGLLGLFGLAGLTGKRRADETTRYRDPNAVGTTTYRE